MGTDLRYAVHAAQMYKQINNCTALSCAFRKFYGFPTTKTGKNTSNSIAPLHLGIRFNVPDIFRV